MKHRPLKQLCGLIASAAIALVLIGCNGKAGQNGTNGTNGTNGAPGTPGASYSIDAATYTPTEWAGLTLKAQITSVTMGTAPVVNFKLTDGHNIPVRGLAAFTSKTSSAAFAGYPNLGLAVAKLVPGTNGSPSRWVSYIVTNNPTAAAPTVWVPTRPTTDNIGTLVDNGDGTYKYTFRRDISQTKAQLDAYTYTGNNLKADLDDVTYDASLTHRITLYVGGIARGTGDTTLGDRSANTADGSNTGLRGVTILNPANTVYDFIPATGSTVLTEQREITSVDKCFTCHAKFEFHGSGRQDTRYCSVCHNDQRKFGRAEATITGTADAGDLVVTNESGKFRGLATGDMTSFIHRLHMGEELQVKGYAYGSLDFNEITYPQDQRNCVKCHSTSAATPQGDNWNTKPSRMACGGCHDKVNFATGEGHGAHSPGAQPNDANCSSANCHTSASIQLSHIPVLPPNPANVYLGLPAPNNNNNTNASFVAGFTNNLPTGAKKPSWEISSFTLNATGKPVIKFRILLDGVPQVLQTYAAGTTTEMLPGFVGGPSVYVAFTVPYDGITYPADWNATHSTYLKDIWRGDGLNMSGGTLGTGNNAASGTLTGPDAPATAWYTITLNSNIPTTAGNLIAGIGYTYGLTNTQPLTQTAGVVGPPWAPNFYAYNVEGKKQGGLSVPAPNVTKMVSGTLPAGFDATKQEARRAIVSNQKCNDCHGVLGLFTAKTYHAGQRNDAPTCEFCHNGQRVNSGWGVNTKDFVHAIHGAGKRVNKYSWESSAGNSYWKITYPSVLNNCEACHVPGSYDFNNTASSGEVPNLNWTTVASGITPSPMNVVVTGTEAIPGVYWSQASKDAAAAANGGVATGYNFGANFGYSANTGATTNAAVTTLVNSPYVAACSNCHDSAMAINHMKANGGSFYVSRASVQANPAAPVAGAALINKEQCFLCHSAGKIADVKEVHMNFK